METKTRKGLVKSISLPVIASIVLIPAVVISELMFKLEVVSHARNALLILLAGWFAVALLKYFAKHANPSYKVVFKLGKLAVLVCCGLAAMQSMGISIMSVLTMGGVALMALGMAAREVLANLMGYLVLNIDRPFMEGDTIKVSGKKGTVTRIGYRSTCILTGEESVVLIPNSTFSSASVENVTKYSLSDEEKGVKSEVL